MSDFNSDTDFEGRKKPRPDRDRRPRRQDDMDEPDSDDGGGRRGRKRNMRARSYYCPDGKCFDYKDVGTLGRFVNETGKIKPRRQTGACARCQRELAREVKRARHIALLPFVAMGDE